MAINGNVYGQRLDNGSSSQAIEQLETPNVGRSYFDLSRVHTTTADFGFIYPMDLFKVVIGDTVDLSSAIMIDSSNPLVKPLMSRVRAYVHYYYSRCTDLWKGYQNFLTAGRSGKISLTLPYVALDQVYNGLLPGLDYFDDTVEDTAVIFSSPMGLSSYFQVPFYKYLVSAKDLTSSQLYVYPYGNFPTMAKFSVWINI